MTTSSFILKVPSTKLKSIISWTIKLGFALTKMTEMETPWTSGCIKKEMPTRDDTCQLDFLPVNQNSKQAITGMTKLNVWLTTSIKGLYRKNIKIRLIISKTQS
jgi:hypothetical protein